MPLRVDKNKSITKILKNDKKTKTTKTTTKTMSITTKTTTTTTTETSTTKTMSTATKKTSKTKKINHLDQFRFHTVWLSLDRVFLYDIFLGISRLYWPLLAKEFAKTFQV